MTEDKCLTMKLAEDTGYTLRLLKGQRKIGPPPDWEGPAPSLEETGIFVGRIPSDCFEYDLFPIFQAVGKIYTIELNKCESRNNKDYAVIRYIEPDHAKAAISLFNDLEIIPEVKLIVTNYFYCCRLFVGNIPLNLTKEFILRELSKLTDNILGIKIFNNRNPEIYRHKYCFIEFESHKTAISVRKKLKSLDLTLGNQKIFVDWAKPEFGLQRNWFAGIKIVYKYVRSDASFTELYSLFSMKGRFKVLFLKKINNAVFAMYENFLDAFIICKILEEKKENIVSYFGIRNKEPRIFRINYYYELLALVEND